MWGGFVSRGSGVAESRQCGEEEAPPGAPLVPKLPVLRLGGPGVSEFIFLWTGLRIRQLRRRSVSGVDVLCGDVLCGEGNVRLRGWFRAGEAASVPSAGGMICFFEKC